MIIDMTTNYNQQHISSPNFKTTGYMANNGTLYYHQGTSPSLGHQQVTQAMAMAVPMMNHPMPLQQPQQPTFFPSPVPSRPSPVGYGYTEPDSQTYCNYLYKVGFLQGHFSDITVSIPSISNTFTLHSLILSRSPYLYQRLLQLDESSTVIELDYTSINTPEAFHTIFTHLYRPLTHQEMNYIMTDQPGKYLDMIGIAERFELVSLKDHLIHLLLAQGFTNEASALRWIPLLQPYDTLRDNDEGWIKTIDDRLLHYLTRGLATQLEAFSTSVKMSGGVVIGKNPAHGYMTSKSIPLRGMTELAQIYAGLPWFYLKRCLEHPDLPVQDMIQRYFFTHKVLQMRRAATPADAQVTVGLRFAKDQDAMVLVKTPKRKLGKWDPTLYPSDESDEE